jgi:hypothetical protein
VVANEATEDDYTIDVGWEKLMQLIADNGINTGIGDLAH